MSESVPCANASRGCTNLASQNLATLGIGFKCQGACNKDGAAPILSGLICALDAVARVLVTPTGSGGFTVTVAIRLRDHREFGDEFSQRHALHCAIIKVLSDSDVDIGLPTTVVIV